MQVVCVCVCVCTSLCTLLAQTNLTFPALLSFKLWFSPNSLMILPLSKALPRCVFLADSNMLNHTIWPLNFLSCQEIFLLVQFSHPFSNDYIFFINKNDDFSPNHQSSILSLQFKYFTATISLLIHVVINYHNLHTL